MILVLTPDRNTPHKADYTGAFLPEAQAFIAAHGGHHERIDQAQGAPQRFRQVVAAVEKHAPETIAYFGHGLRRSAAQLGLSLQNVKTLASAIAASSTAPRIILYACSTADGTAPGGEGGLADGLRDELVAAGAQHCQIDAHVTAGHTTWNPNVRRFTSATSLGGEWLVAPGSIAWNAWVRALRGPFRFAFPWMVKDEILKFLRPVDA